MSDLAFLEVLLKNFLTFLTDNCYWRRVLVVAAEVMLLVELFYFVVKYLGILSLVNEWKKMDRQPTFCPFFAKVHSYFLLVHEPNRSKQSALH